MNTTSLLDYVIAQLDQHRGNWAAVVEGSGVPMSTLERIANRKTPNPGIRHVEALARHFRGSRRRASP